MSNPQHKRLGVYRHDGDSYLIEVRLRDLRQLFNTLDPAPFREKDLDPAAEEYLVGAVRELGSRPGKLRLHVPAATPGDDARALVDAVRHYFHYRGQHALEQLHLLLRRGVISFAIGLAFLFICLYLRQLATALGGDSPVLTEGLLILGWVAMWRPVEIFLYDWWPGLGTRRLYTRIATMPIEAVAPERAHA